MCICLWATMLVFNGVQRYNVPIHIVSKKWFWKVFSGYCVPIWETDGRTDGQTDVQCYIITSKDVRIKTETEFLVRTIKTEDRWICLLSKRKGRGNIIMERFYISMKYWSTCTRKCYNIWTIYVSSRYILRIVALDNKKDSTASYVWRKLHKEPSIWHNGFNGYIKEHLCIFVLYWQCTCHWNVALKKPIVYRWFCVSLIVSR